MAYRIGYDEGMLTTPPVVVQKSDEKAMQNLDSYSIMMDSMSMNCLRDRICQYRLFGCFMSF